MKQKQLVSQFKSYYLLMTPFNAKPPKISRCTLVFGGQEEGSSKQGVKFTSVWSKFTARNGQLFPTLFTLWLGLFLLIWNCFQDSTCTMTKNVFDVICQGYSPRPGLPKSQIFNSYVINKYSKSYLARQLIKPGTG